ncbi:putative membrane protein DUF2142 [Myceligenerans xiligouense]|uniref:Putative membrane protein DUF2142 n=1 Tax=Myceligenerans xiligouense TaxID=253184 RepID=A0A3N4ZGX5_9MICO|nr:putative membrane protein DUF2142 [Myceligenerans xiligouense]
MAGGPPPRRGARAISYADDVIRTLARAASDPRRREHAGVVAAALTAVLLSLTVLLTDPPYATGDEPPHMDYAYQVWHGELPVFEEGLELRPEGAWLAPVQWTAQHPPLYYLLVAPLVGPLADAGHPVAAVYAARAVNTLLAGLFVVVAWWSARRLSRPGSPLPPLVALVACLTAAVAHVGGSGYNDLLAAVLVTTMYGVSATAIRRGLDGRLVAALCLLAAGCALTRLSTAVIAVVVAAVAVLAGVVRAAQGRGRRAPVVWLAVGGPVTALAAAGWFYARNVALTGNIQGSHFDWALANQNRTERTVWEVLTDPITWARLPDLFWWAGRVPPRTDHPLTTLILTAVLLVWIPLFLAVLDRVRRRRGTLRSPEPVTTDPPAGDARTLHAAATAPAGEPLPAPAAPWPGSLTDRRLLLALPWTAVGVAIVLQVLYAASSGGVYPRYFLPVALPLFLGVAAGLAVRPRLLVPVWAGITLADLGVWLVLELSTPAEAGLYSEPVAPAAAVGVLAVASAVGATVLTLRAYRRPTTTAAAATSTATRNQPPS